MARVVGYRQASRASADRTDRQTNRGDDRRSAKVRTCFAVHRHVHTHTHTQITHTYTQHLADRRIGLSKFEDHSERRAGPSARQAPELSELIEQEIGKRGRHSLRLH